MERIAAAFLRSRFRMFPNPWDHIRGLFYDLQDELEGYTGAADGNFERDMLVAEELVKAVYNERSIIALNDPFAYAKVLECLWKYEDQGYFSNSSLINDLVIQALLELCCYTAQQPCITAIQNMFVVANPENKRFLVLAVMLALFREQSRPLEELWQHGIVACIGKSAMRMEVVESALIDQCQNYHFFNESTKRGLLFCIQTLISLPVFDSNGLRNAIWSMLTNVDAGNCLTYVSFFQAVAKMDEKNLMTYIENYISLLKTPNSVPKMELQFMVYEAIDQLKRKLNTSIYQAPIYEAFK